ncbi:nucleoside recognition protein [uncultured Ruminococcus sp.]|uniref:nucleoside recognition protein n=1 Tax=uncultured Ruminococcus sp. TaxID=165186 RepID=UPI0025FEE416|nr:nucleoside recognition protein [uncultured Ruminococcus sp.]
MADNNISRRTKDMFLCILLTAAAAGTAVFTGEISAGVREAVLRCVNVLIPSLFAFMAVSDMLIKSGGLRIISKSLRPIARYIFNCPEELFMVFFISSAAGYPLGIKLLSDMLERGETDTRTAEKAACFCYCGGPAFYSGAIGLAVFDNTSVGKLIYVSVMFSNIIIALLVCRTSKLSVIKKQTPASDGNILIDSVKSAGKSMGMICMTVVLFAALMAIADASGLFAWIQHSFGLSDNEMILLRSVIEITSLTELKGCPFVLLPLISAVCSFGGVCIIMQLYALKNTKLSMLVFWKIRLPSAVLSAFVCRLLRPYIVGDAVCVISNNQPLLKIDNFAASICMILMIFLLNYKKSLVFCKRV